MQDRSGNRRFYVTVNPHGGQRRGPRLLKQVRPVLEAPPTSQHYRAVNKHDPDRPAPPDEEWAMRVHQAVRQVGDGYDTVLKNVYVRQLEDVDGKSPYRRAWINASGNGFCRK